MRKAESVIVNECGPDARYVNLTPGSGTRRGRNCFKRSFATFGIWSAGVPANLTRRFHASNSFFALAVYVSIKLNVATSCL